MLFLFLIYKSHLLNLLSQLLMMDMLFEAPQWLILTTKLICYLQEVRNREWPFSFFPCIFYDYFTTSSLETRQTFTSLFKTTVKKVATNPLKGTIYVRFFYSNIQKPLEQWWDAHDNRMWLIAQH